MKKDTYKLKRLWILLLIPIALVMLGIAKSFPWVAEYVFARKYYHFAANGITFITKWIPFSLAEWLVVAAPFVLVILIVIWIIHMAKNRGRIRFVFFKGVIDILCIASVIAFMIISFAMVNINRYSFTKYCDLTVEEYSKDELIRLCEGLVKDANSARKKVVSDDNGIAAKNISFNEMCKYADDAYKAAAKDFPVLNNVYNNAKPVFFSHYMSYSDLVGVYAPFTIEANVDVDVPFYKQPATLCHELAHVQGFMKEDEANYIAYVVCMYSEIPIFEYSGIMSVLSRSLNQLYDQDQEAYSKMFKLMSKDVISDVEFNSKYWNDIYSNKTAQAVSKATTTFNDNYLKISGQEGVKSYGLVVDLLLAKQRKEDKNK